MYSTKYTLNDHIKKEHDKIVKFICDVCGKGYPSKTMMTSHRNYHGGVHCKVKPKKTKRDKEKPPPMYDAKYFQL